jgi:predicted nuclease of predicted toxin-antitoxin system
MYFLLDEQVPRAVAELLERLGHEVVWIRNLSPQGSPDPLVATVSEELGAILISFDGDFEKIAPRIPKGHRARFRKLSRIWMRCSEPQAAARLESGIKLIECEYALAQLRSDKRMMMSFGTSFIRTDR